MNHLEFARDLWDLGICPIPVDEIKKSPAISSWGKYQHEYPKRELLDEWFKNSERVAVVCGSNSRNLHCLDFDSGNSLDAFERNASPEAKAIIQKLASGYLEKTSKGHHILFACEPPLEKKVVPAHYKAGEKTLASGRVIDDVRGVVEILTGGQYVIIAPSNGYTLLSGDARHILKITPEERAILITELGRVLNQYTRAEPKKKTARLEPYQGESKIDFFNESNDVLDMAYADGWQFNSNAGDITYLTRPGKEISEGISASYNHDDLGKFANFSTSMPEFPAEKYLDPFDYMCHRDFNGDKSLAARAVALANPTTFGHRKVVPISGDITLPEGANEPSPPRNIPLPPKGILLDWVNWLRARGRPFHEDQDELYLGAGLSFFGFTLSAKHRLEGFNSQLGIFATLISPTGTGKGTCLATIKDAFPRCQMDDPNVRSHVSSGEALLGMFKEAVRPDGYVMLDEIGHVLQAASNNRGPMHSLAAHLLELYYATKGVHKQYADSANNVKLTVAPELSLLGATTPKKFVDAVMDDFITSGLANRILYFEGRGTAKPRGVVREGKLPAPIPGSIPSKVRDWQSAPAGSFIKCPEEMDEAIEEATRGLHERTLGLSLSSALGRIKENYLRVLGIVSACNTGSVTLEDVEYVERLMHYQIETVSGIVESVSHKDGSRFNEKCDAAMDFMRRRSKKGWPTTARDLLRGPLRQNKSFRDDVMEYLEAGGLIKQREVINNNETISVFIELTE